MPQFEITLTDSGGGIQRVVVEAKDSWSARLEAQRLHPFSEVSAVDSAAPGAASTPRGAPGGGVPPNRGPRLQAVPPRAPTPPPPPSPWKAKEGEVFNLYPSVDDANAELRHKFKKDTPPLPNQNVAWPTPADLDAYYSEKLTPDYGRSLMGRELKAVPPPRPPWMDIIPQRAWDDVGRLQGLRNDLSGAAFAPSSSRQIRGQITRLENRLGPTELQDVSNDPAVREFVNRKAGVLQPPPAPNRLPDLAQTSPGRPPLRGFPQDWGGFEATAPGTGPSLFQRPPIEPDHPIMRGSMASYPDFGASPSPGVMGMESAPPGSVRPQGPLPGWPFPVPPERFSDGELQSLLRDALPEHRDGVLREISRRQSFARPVGPSPAESSVPPNMPVRGLSPAKPPMPNETGAMSGPVSMPEPGLRAPTRPPTPAPDDGLPSWFPRNPPPMSKSEIGVSMMGAGSPRPPTVNDRPPAMTPAQARFSRGMKTGLVGGGVAGAGVLALDEALAAMSPRYREARDTGNAAAFNTGREGAKQNPWVSRLSLMSPELADTALGQGALAELSGAAAMMDDPRIMRTPQNMGDAFNQRDPSAIREIANRMPPPVFARELPQRNVGRPEPEAIRPYPGNEWPQPAHVTFDEGSEIVGRPKPMPRPAPGIGPGAGPGKAGMALDMAKILAMSAPDDSRTPQPEIVPVSRLPDPSMIPAYGKDLSTPKRPTPMWRTPQPEIVPARPADFGSPTAGAERLLAMNPGASVSARRSPLPIEDVEEIGFGDDGSEIAVPRPGRPKRMRPPMPPQRPEMIYDAIYGTGGLQAPATMRRDFGLQKMRQWAPDGMY